MKIVHCDPNNPYTLDGQAYLRLCNLLGTERSDREDLEIHFVLTIPEKPYVPADFRRTGGRSLIRVRTLDWNQRRYNSRQLNQFVLHETKHWADYSATGRCHAPGHLLLPHDNRPAERMATAFARHYKHTQLIIQRSKNDGNANHSR
jgi:hypothetical protein